MVILGAMVNYHYRIIGQINMGLNNNRVKINGFLWAVHGINYQEVMAAIIGSVKIWLQARLARTSLNKFVFNICRYFQEVPHKVWLPSTVSTLPPVHEQRAQKGEAKEVSPPMPAKSAQEECKWRCRKPLQQLLPSCPASTRNPLGTPQELSAKLPSIYPP